MGKSIYKYFSKDVFDLVFCEEGVCRIKCSLPKNYNDPFELFLGADLSISPDLLAVYREIITDIPQIPTTCFSKSPSVNPMWAHYANNHSGFVVEFDSECLKSEFPSAALADVEYRDKPSDRIADILEYVNGTKKMRHAYILVQTVLKEAYFSKYFSWSYEEECRFIDQGNCCSNESGIHILNVPVNCCKSIIVGNKSIESFASKSREFAEKIGIDWYYSCIGKSIPNPYFMTYSGGLFLHDGIGLAECKKYCEVCREPVFGEGDFCPWCAITEDDATNAARGNPFRILDKFGLMEEYFSGMKNIGK